MPKAFNNISLIAAVGKNNELGRNNTLIWRFKEDMRFFKENTMGQRCKPNWVFRYITNRR